MTCLNRIFCLGFTVMFGLVGPAGACESCKSTLGDPGSGGGSGLTAGMDSDEYRWTSDLTFTYKNWDRINAAHGLATNEIPGRHTHGVIDEWTAALRIGGRVTNDLELGITQSYRSLRQINVEDPLVLGRHEYGRGFGDLAFDLRWRFKRQTEGGFPVDLALLGEAQFPTGQTREHGANGELLDAENQPGGGGWSGTIGLAVSRRWNRWGASGAVAYTYKTEGTQEFKPGDVLRVGAGGSFRLTPDSWGTKIWLSGGVQALFENKAREDGAKDPNHGGQFLFLNPSLAVQPLDRLTITAGLQIPVYQEMNGYHQKEAGSAFIGVRIRF